MAEYSADMTVAAMAGLTAALTASRKAASKADLTGSRTHWKGELRAGAMVF